MAFRKYGTEYARELALVYKQHNRQNKSRHAYAGKIRSLINPV